MHQSVLMYHYSNTTSVNKDRIESVIEQEDEIKDNMLI